MDHVAIMRKSWHLTEKILSGEKTIESRWYQCKYAPWNRIDKDDIVYFKDSGEPVTIQATVSKVLQFSDLNGRKVKEILDIYGGKDGICISDIDKFYKRFENRRYCILVFLKNPKKVEPFNIDKTGFGNMAAWLSVDKIERLKRI